jgi:hypothetical protein
VQLAGVGGLLRSGHSGGMRKRVALARALGVRPEAVLFDAPTTGLGPGTTAHVNRLMRDVHWRLNVRSIEVTHDVASALEVADRACFPCEGRVAFDGSVDDARTRPSLELGAFMHGEPQARLAWLLRGVRGLRSRRSRRRGRRSQAKWPADEVAVRWRGPPRTRIRQVARGPGHLPAAWDVHPREKNAPRRGPRGVRACRAIAGYSPGVVSSLSSGSQTSG